MDIKTLRKAEIETMFFGFSTRDLCEDFNLEVINCIHETMNRVKETFLEMNPENSENINRYIQDLTNIYIEAFKPISKKFQSEVETLFYISENVELYSIGASNEIVTDEDIMKVNDEIKQLTEQILQEKVMLAKLEQLKGVFDNKVKGMMKTVSNLLSVSRHIAFSSASTESSHALTMAIKKVLNETYLQK